MIDETTRKQAERILIDCYARRAVMRENTDRVIGRRHKTSPENVRMIRLGKPPSRTVTPEMKAEIEANINVYNEAAKGYMPLDEIARSTGITRRVIVNMAGKLGLTEKAKRQNAKPKTKPDSPETAVDRFMGMMLSRNPGHHRTYY